MNNIQMIDILKKRMETLKNLWFRPTIEKMIQRKQSFKMISEGMLYRCLKIIY